MKRLFVGLICGAFLLGMGSKAYAQDWIPTEVTGYGVPISAELEYNADAWTLDLLGSVEAATGQEYIEEPSVLGNSYSEDQMTEEAIRNRMLAKKAEYPEGMHWTNANFYGWSAGVYSGGYGCAGFAFMLSDAAFGTSPQARILEERDFGSIRVGDILRINQDTHSVVVLEVHSNYVVIAEGNYNSSIHWGRTLTKDSLENGQLTYIMTRYQTNPVEHHYQVVSTTGNTVTVQCTDCGRTDTIIKSTEAELYLTNNPSYGYSSYPSFRTEGIYASLYDSIFYHIEGDSECTDSFVVEVVDQSVAAFEGGGNRMTGKEGKIMPVRRGVTNVNIRSAADDSIIETYKLTILDANNPFPIECEEMEIEAPVRGMYPQRYLQAGMFCEVVSVEWLPEVDSYFAGDTAYTVRVKLRAYEGYCYNVNTVFKVNGNVATLESIHGQEAVIQYMFEATEPEPHYHSYYYVPYKWATCFEDGYKSHYECSGCDKIFANTWSLDEIEDPSSIVLPAAHTPQEEWRYDETNHWHICIQCNDKCENVKHVYSTALDTLCDICGYERTIPDNLKVEEVFEDVVPGYWYVSFIQFAFDRRLMIGSSADLFGTNKGITRAEFVQVLYSMEGKPAVGYLDTFTDVASNNWFASAVLWANEKGIVSGTGNGKFSPNATITREQVALMLKKYAEYKNYYVAEGAELSTFSDSQTVSSWARQSMSWAVGAGVISGKGQQDGSKLLVPQGNASRAECAAMLKSFCERFEN